MLFGIFIDDGTELSEASEHFALAHSSSFRLALDSPFILLLPFFSALFSLAHYIPLGPIRIIGYLPYLDLPFFLVDLSCFRQVSQSDRILLAVIGDVVRLD